MNFCWGLSLPLSFHLFLHLFCRLNELLHSVASAYLSTVNPCTPWFGKLTFQAPNRHPNLDVFARSSTCGVQTRQRWDLLGSQETPRGAPCLAGGMAPDPVFHRDEEGGPIPDTTVTTCLGQDGLPPQTCPVLQPPLAVSRVSYAIAMDVSVDHIQREAWESLGSHGACARPVMCSTPQMQRKTPTILTTVVPGPPVHRPLNLVSRSPPVSCSSTRPRRGAGDRYPCVALSAGAQRIVVAGSR